MVDSDDALSQWYDEPIGKIANDLLRRKEYAETLSVDIRRWLRQGNVVLSLFGGWGTGKTTLINFITDRLDSLEEPATIVINFNPWQCENKKILHESLFNEIITAINSIGENNEVASSRANKMRKYSSLLSLGNQITQPVADILKLLMVPGSPLVASLSDGFKRLAEATKTGSEGLDAQAKLDAINNLSEFKNQLSKDLEKLEQPILVVIDDIDRLPDEEIRSLIQLVKANANFPRITFILVCDRNRVAKALNPLNTIEGDHFLEKVIQVSYYVPVVELALLENILMSGLDRVMKNFNVIINFTDNFTSIYLRSVRYYFKTIRDVKRFLSSFEFFVSVFSIDGFLQVNINDLFLLVIMQIFEPELYSQIPFNKSTFINYNPMMSSAIMVRFSVLDEAELKNNYNNIMNCCREKELAEICLSYLFPKIAQYTNRSSSYDRMGQNSRIGLRVSDIHIFDRYFTYSIPSGQIRENIIYNIITTKRTSDELLAIFRDYIENNEFLFLIGQLELFTGLYNTEIIPEFITSLMIACDECDNTHKLLLMNPADIGTILVRNLIELLPVNRRSTTLLNAIKYSQAVLTSTYICYEESKLLDESSDTKAESIFNNNDIRKAKRIITKLIKQSSIRNNLFDNSNYGFILYRWMEWGNKTQVRKWISNNINENNNFIKILELAIDHGKSYGRYAFHIETLSYFVNVKQYIKTAKKMNIDILNDHDKILLQSFLHYIDTEIPKDNNIIQ